MLLLPSIRWSQRLDQASVRLPCPVDDWFALISGCEDSLTQILRWNPSVFLFACASYHDDLGRCVCEWSDLVRWSYRRLPSELTKRYFAEDRNHQVGSIFGHCRTKKLVKKWLNAKGKVPVQRLEKFVAAACGLSKEVLGSDRPEWLPSQLKIETVQKRDASGRKLREQLTKQWLQQDQPGKIEQVQRLLYLKQQSLEIRRQFADRLQQEKLESMKQLAYGASHEINNPLANIASRAQAMVQTEKNLSRRHKLATIYEQAMRAHEMISDMMLFANPPQLQIRRTDLRLLIPSVIRDVETCLNRQEECHQKQIGFRVTLGPELQPVDIDPGQIAVLLHCLVKNSIEAIESEGWIELSARREAGEVIQLAVSDNGGGVTDLAKRHLFDPFYSGREAGRGLGFGLSKAWRIAQLHRASLSLDESYTPGARFVLALPLGSGRLAAHNRPANEMPFSLADPKSHAA